jgi:hypothetical protein
MMPTESERRSAWRPLRMRVAMTLSLTLGFIPGGLLVEATRAPMWAMWLWGIAWIASIVVIFATSCPNCRRPFFVKEIRGTPLIIRWPFTTRCHNCGVRVGANLARPLPP